MLMATGGAGYIGSHAVRALRAAGHDVVAYDDLSEGHADALLGAPLVQGDIRDTPRLEAALRAHRVRAVLHFAARCYVGESMEQPALYWSINRDGTRSLLAAMAAAGTPALVFSSTWVLVAKPGVLAHPRLADGALPIEVRPGFRPWADDYSSIFSALK